MREGVGLIEISNYGKFEVTGPGAEAFLSRVMANKVPEVGRLTLTPMLNERGKLIGDFTIVPPGEGTLLPHRHLLGRELLPPLVRAASAANAA